MKLFHLFRFIPPPTDFLQKSVFKALAAGLRRMNCDFYKVAQIVAFCKKRHQKLLRDPLDRMNKRRQKLLISNLEKLPYGIRLK